MGIVDDLSDLFADGMGWRKVLTTDRYGDPTSYAASVPLDVHLGGRIRMVRDRAGNEQVSSIQATIADTPGVAVGDEFTLPADYDPRQPEALAVQPSRDEDGAHHETVFFR